MKYLDIKGFFGIRLFIHKFSCYCCSSPSGLVMLTYPLAYSFATPLRHPHRTVGEDYPYKMLQSNGHPANFIKEATRPPRGISAIPNQPENAPPTIRRSLPYIQNISESVDRRLNPCNVKIAQRPHSPLRSNLVHFKDPVPTLQRCKFIYQTVIELDK